MNDDEFRKEILNIIYWFHEYGNASDVADQLIELGNKIKKGKGVSE